MNPLTSYSIFPLGDSAITIDLGNCIEESLNRRALALHDWLQAHRRRGVVDIIVAYSSVTLFYDPTLVRVDGMVSSDSIYYYMKELLEQAWKETENNGNAMLADNQSDKEVLQGGVKGHFFRIPVCYEGIYGPDLPWVAAEKGISVEEVIRLHHSLIYRIYMIGFLPAFPYMGKIDPRLVISRKKTPVSVLAGGVGIAGMQTGIYPLTSPGGWQIIGKTPVKLFLPGQDPPVRLQAGDQVQFYPISPEEFIGWRQEEPGS